MRDRYVPPEVQPHSVVTLNNLAFITGNKSTIEIEGHARISENMFGSRCFICGHRIANRDQVELMRLDCTDLFHKHCVMEHFRYTDRCPIPSCNKDVYIVKIFTPN